jgi:hypothetical protein
MVPRTNVDLWDGKQAWKVANRIFEMDVLGENFPDIASTIRSPASGMPDVKGFFRSFSSPPGVSKFDVPSSKVPHLHPAPSSFEAYINLLACFDGWSEIPVALVWMRTLNMEPQRRTLYTAILYFDDDHDQEIPPVVMRLARGGQCAEPGRGCGRESGGYRRWTRRDAFSIDGTVVGGGVTEHI